MRQRSIIYALFLAIGIILLLSSYIAKASGNLLVGDTSKDLGVVIISLVLVDLLWKLVGGDPLSKEIAELKKYNNLHAVALEGGLEGLILKANDAKTEVDWLEMIKKSQEHIDICGHTLVDIAEKPDWVSALKNRAESGVHIRLILNSPSNPTLPNGINPDIPNLPKMMEDMKFSWNKFTELQNSLPVDKQSNLSVVQIKTDILFINIRRFDEKLYLLHYLYSTLNEYCPVFIFEGHQKQLFKLYLDEFNKIYSHNL
jgi:hypothetical protein